MCLRGKVRRTTTFGHPGPRRPAGRAGMGFSDWGAEYGISLFGVAARDEVDGLCQWDGRWRTGCLGVRLAVLD